MGFYDRFVVVWRCLYGGSGLSDGVCLVKFTFWFLGGILEVYEMSSIFADLNETRELLIRHESVAGFLNTFADLADCEVIFAVD